jgi:hypothetical protein
VSAHRLVVAATAAWMLLALAARRAAGQGATAAAPDTMPATSPSDSTAGGPATFELRLAGFEMPATHLVGVTPASYATSSPSFTGAEFLIRSTDGGGLRLRYATAPASGSNVAGTAMSDLDGRLSIGTRTFNLELGYLLETETTGGASQQHGFGRAGFRSDINLGSSGITAGFAASYLREPTAEKDSAQGQGIEGETSVLYAPAALPVYVQLGYVRQAFRFSYPNAPNRPEEVSMVLIGAGFQVGTH